MKVLFCGDAERPGNFAIGNVNWMAGMLRSFWGNHPQVLLHTPPSILSGDEWVRTFYNRDTSYTWERIQYYSDGVEVIVAGYELPPNILDKVKSHGMNYFNMAVSPIRYCPDLYISVQSNMVDLRDLPSVREREFIFYANALKARKGRKMVGGLKPGTTLIIGQTPMDSSLLYRGEGDVGKLLRQTPETWNHIPEPKLFKPHPGNLGEKFGDVPLTGENIYDLLCSDEIVKVVGMSSSVLDEAVYFGKQVERLGPCPYSPATGYKCVSPSSFFGVEMPYGFFREDHWANHPAPRWGRV